MMHPLRCISAILCQKGTLLAIANSGRVSDDAKSGINNSPTAQNTLRSSSRYGRVGTSLCKTREKASWREWS